jgi:hypothetical protein
MLGILTLDTAFPRIAGDIGAPETFAFPVRHAVVAGATPDEIVHRRQDVLLPRFVAAAHELAAAGCLGITTTCGFLVRWQRELTTAMRVPSSRGAAADSLLAQTAPFGRKVGSSHAPPTI